MAMSGSLEILEHVGSINSTIFCRAVRDIPLAGQTNSSDSDARRAEVHEYLYDEKGRDGLIGHKGLLDGVVMELLTATQIIDAGHMLVDQYMCSETCPCTDVEEKKEKIYYASREPLLN